MRGADLLVQSLHAAGVRTVFALSGNQIMPLFDACVDAGLRLIHVRHEAAAVYMAEAWAQITGEVGVALLTAGPGFANGLSPLFSARQSESPVLLLSGDAPCARDGMGAFQELAQTAIAAPLTKRSTRARAANALGAEVLEAIALARGGRPGPVHLALPFDVLNAEVTAAQPSAAAPPPGDDASLDPPTLSEIADLLAGAERPLLLAGPSLSRTRAPGLTERLAAQLDLPVIAMESPRGLKDPCLGDVRGVLGEADLVLALGKRIDFTLGFADPPVVSANCRFVLLDPEAEVLAQAGAALGARLVLGRVTGTGLAARALLGYGPARPARREAWRARVRAALAARGPEPATSARVSPTEVGRAVQRVLDAAEDPLLVVDGGEFGQWMQATVDAPRRIINGPGGAIGGGLCYAIAAKLARPGATVVALMGDGTAGFHLAEFETALRCGAAVVAVVGNDARWNAEVQIQLREYGAERLIGCELSATRYDLAVAGLGGHGEHVGRADALETALGRALASGLPACINVEIEGLAAPSGSGH